MRFYHKPSPEHGEYRKITKFLYFPKRIGNQTRWLEMASWSEIYCDGVVDGVLYTNEWVARDWYG